MTTVTEELTMLDVAEVPQHPAPAVQQTGALSANSPATMMMAMMERGATLEQIEKMMDLQVRHERREAEKAYNEGLAAFKSKPIRIVKRKLVDFQTQKGRTTYKHAELDDVVSAVGPELSAHGFSWSWDTTQQDRTITVKCTLRHRLGHSESVSLSAMPDESGGKNSIQAIISTTTYLQRHTLKQITGVAEAGDDDDGQGGAPVPDELIQPARDAAMGGTEALRAYWKTLSEGARAALKNELPALKEAAKAADAEGAKA